MLTFCGVLDWRLYNRCYIVGIDIVATRWRDCTGAKFVSAMR